ncbi:MULTISPECIES: DUF1553 domain-containing protein [unclassified Arcicella]|uniref:DUF1553 domain-containing protein n=1 Tax=unclassified Arcicella TaxID=2644986 RepID=UPI00285622A5|nr:MULTISPECIES: DUF1553 domain-containing protein [unclassified Arcicella]MDR6560317.1 hypothetical protein [Arcicella sp. BE51]MDR6810077.1 hypothetical protein [Arcicella sp. BE140]MDR6821426.1 hypothetical protein [Arcicella sp. BE139]
MVISTFKKSAIFLSCILLLACGSTETPAELATIESKLPDKIDYNIHIKPILSDRCFKCHGPDKNKVEAGLQLTNFEGATEKLKSGNRAVVEGNIDKSELIKRILSHDPDMVMPTPKSNLTLTDEEKALLIKWVKQGAEYKEHWAFTKIEKPEVPTVKQHEWVKNPIDNFILQKLEEQHISPSPHAEKATLLRRVSMDITGLPPTVKELDAFLKDTSPNAYEKVVDRLLKSPHYGEKMGVEWLDIARYADSHGYQDDGIRNAFPWRDWVINSFNRNLSYDKFVTWQLAGDLLPNPTQEQLMATCFLRNHPQTQEGGVVDEEYRTEYVIDRVNTFGKAFLGLTVECARCHDHKYDPIAQKEFYQLSAFFNNNNESGIIPYNGEASPTVMIPTADIQAKIDFIKKKIAPFEEAIKPTYPIYRKNFDQWVLAAQKEPSKFATSNKDLVANFSFERIIPKTNKRFDNNLKKEVIEVKNIAYQNTAVDSIGGWIAGDMDRRPKFIKGKVGNGILFRGDCGIDFHRALDFERVQPFSISLWINPLKKGEHGPIYNSSNGEFEGQRGYKCWLLSDGSLQVSLSYVWPANCIDIITTDKVLYKQWQNITLTYDGSSKASGVKIYQNGQEMKTTVLVDNLKKSMKFGEHHTNWSSLPFMMGKEFHETMQNFAVDELKIYTRQLSPIEILGLAKNKEQVSDILKTPRNEWTATQAQQLFDYFRLNFDPYFSAYSRNLLQLREKENILATDIKEVMIMSERKIPRKTFILNRGSYDAPSTEVTHGVINKLLPFDDDLPKNRLGLAQWLLDERHPLFARVAVNRFWQNYFGFGLCKTSDDFGNQGEMPSHPALLDWLATTFRESGWNIKAMQKLIVMSATYQQSSKKRKDLMEIDSENRLLARGPSYRYAHEQIRDAILEGSGLLVHKIGGSSVYPYQPSGIWEALATRNATSYRQQHGDSLYRRGLYTIWKRSSPPPSSITFDAPERYFCVVKRQKTSTPLQSLIMMNDPQYNEAARKLAERMMREGGQSPETRITFAYKAMISRYPRPTEINVLKALYQEELADLNKKPARIKELLSVGESPIDQTLNQKELAANTVLAMTLINFDGTLIKR